MQNLNEKQYNKLELFIETIICENCTEQNKDCSSCQLYKKIMENLCNGIEFREEGI